MSLVSSACYSTPSKIQNEGNIETMNDRLIWCAQGTNAGLFTLRSHGYYLDHLQPTKNHYGVYVVPPGMRADETNGRRHLSRQVENPKRSSKAISQLLHNTQQIRHQRLSSRRGLILGGEACMYAVGLFAKLTACLCCPNSLW